MSLIKLFQVCCIFDYVQLSSFLGIKCLKSSLPVSVIPCLSTIDNIFDCHRGGSFPNVKPRNEVVLIIYSVAFEKKKPFQVAAERIKYKFEKKIS